MSEVMGVLFAILVGIMVIPKFADYQTASNNNTRAAVTAQQQKQLIAAATTYVQQNSGAVQAIATPTTPAVITVAMMQAAGVDLLPASFSATNPYGQTWQVEVLEPTAGNLQALVMSTGGTTLTDAQSTKIAAIVGAAGGFIPQNDSGIYPSAAANAYGSFAGWTIPTTNYTGVTGGHLAALLTFNNGQLVSNYLYRNAVPGQPQLNTMNTALNMGGNSITNLTAITAAQLADSPAGTGNCASNGDFGRGPNGEVVSCVSGKWKAAGGSAYWGDPASVGTNTPTQAQLDAALGVCTNTAPPMSRVHMLSGASGQPRPYVCDGVDWQPVAVDLAGNLTAAGLIKSAMWQPTTIVTENTSDTNCAVADPTTWSRTARDAAGLLLSCQSGSWKKAQGDIGSGSICGFWNEANGPFGYSSFNKTCLGYMPPSCPPGYTSGGSPTGHYWQYFCVKN